MGTLSLEKPAQKTPVFDERAHSGEVCGEPGVKFVQGKNYFDNMKRFVREAPEAAWLAPLTEEQEYDRRMQIQRNQKLHAQKVGRNAGAVPQSVQNAERENARARAAEARAG